MRLAFENHATSKLVTPEQLDDIRTLGFRGEALPSIAAVARVEMTTRAKAQEAGTRLNVEGGRNMIVREIGCPEGTTVIMRDLFFNIPVRRAFLRKAQYEAALVNDTVARMILGSPKISFRFINNGRTVYHSFGDGDLRHAVFAVYGRETAENMLEVDQGEGAMRIRGLVGVGTGQGDARPTGILHQWPLGALSAALAGFGERLPRTRHHRHVSMCALHLTLAPEVWMSMRAPRRGRDAHRRGKHAPRRAAPAIVAIVEKHTVEQLPLPDMDNVTANTTEVQNVQTEVANPETEVSDKATRSLKRRFARRRLRGADTGGTPPSGHFTERLRAAGDCFAPWPKRARLCRMS